MCTDSFCRKIYTQSYCEFIYCRSVGSTFLCVWCFTYLVQVPKHILYQWKWNYYWTTWSWMPKSLNRAYVGQQLINRHLTLRRCQGGSVVLTSSQTQTPVSCVVLFFRFSFCLYFWPVLLNFLSVTDTMLRQHRTPLDTPTAHLKPDFCKMNSRPEMWIVFLLQFLTDFYFWSRWLKDSMLLWNVLLNSLALLLCNVTAYR